MPLMGLGASDINGLCGLFSSMTLLVTMLCCNAEFGVHSIFSQRQNVSQNFFDLIKCFTNCPLYGQ